MRLRSTKKLIFRLVCALVLPALSVPAGAAAQPAWSEALPQDPRLAADVGWLEIGQEKAMYLYKPSAGAVDRGTAVLLHDLRAHADWPQIVRPLRENLPRQGWATLSLQLPPIGDTVEPQAYYQAVAARISAALALASKQSDQPLMLIGAGTGANAALWYLANNPKNPVRGLVAVSLRPMPEQATPDPKTLFAAMDKPVLEVFAERDHPSVLAGIANRESLAARRPPQPADRRPKTAPALYRQILMEGADADYAGQAEVLTKRIRGWMQLHVDR